MEEIKVIVADDSETSRIILRRMLEALPNLSMIGEAKDGEELLQQVYMEEPNLVLVDISMPNLNGLDAIKECIKILPELKVIFITGHDEYALEAFNVSAVDYIIKPINKVRLYQAVEKARKMIQSRTDEAFKKAHRMKGGMKKLILRSEKTIYFSSFMDILFIEKVGRKSLVHTSSKVYEINETLGALLRRLDYAFIQTHRSYIINFEHVSSITNSGDTNLVYFDNYKTPAYISKHKMSDVLHFIEKMTENGLN